MSDPAVALTVAAILAFSLAAAYWQIRRAQRAESERNRLIREAHEQAAAARQQDDIELAWSLPAYAGPDHDAGCDRLRNAIRQQREDEQS